MSTKTAYSSQSRLVPSSDGINIYARATGNPSNPSLVFVHGIALSSVVFDDLFEDERLLEKYYLVAYDLRGHGRSDKPTNPEAYASKLWADDFAAVSKSFGLVSPIFVGWSYAGTIPTEILAHYPAGTIKAIVGLAPAGNPGAPPMDFNTEESFAYYPGFLSAQDIDAHFKSKVGFVDACFKDASSVPSQLRYALISAAVSQPPEVTAQIFGRVTEQSSLNAAGKAGLPLLLIQGSADRLLRTEAVAKYYKELFTNIELLTLEGGSHVPFYEHKDEVIRALVAFSDKIFSL